MKNLNLGQLTTLEVMLELKVNEMRCLSTLSDIDCNYKQFIQKEINHYEEIKDIITTMIKCSENG